MVVIMTIEFTALDFLPFASDTVSLQFTYLSVPTGIEIWLVSKIRSGAFISHKVARESE